jgi:hypothetical protein
MTSKRSSAPALEKGVINQQKMGALELFVQSLNRNYLPAAAFQSVRSGNVFPKRQTDFVRDSLKKAGFQKVGRVPEAALDWEESLPL